MTEKDGQKKIIYKYVYEENKEWASKTKLQTKRYK